MDIPPDLLIAAAVDLEGGIWPRESQRQIGRAMGRGQAGALRTGVVGGAFMAARADVASDSSTDNPIEIRPHCGPDGTYTLLAGRIHDRKDLALQLGVPITGDDAQLYGQIYAKYGRNCDARIYGDYAVIQWHPARRMMRLARSASGICPIHIWRDGSRLVAASTAAVLIAAGMDPELDDQKLGDALLLNYRDGARSWFRRGGRVESGSFQIHDPDGSNCARFWSIHDVPSLCLRQDRDYVEAVDEQFRRGVAAEMHGIAQPAIALSGGLDSQAVATYLIDYLGDDGHLPSITSVPQPGWSSDGRPTSFGDEGPYAAALAQMYRQLDPHFITAEHRPFGADLDAMHRLIAWPVRNETNMHWIHEMYSKANMLGCDAIFVGAAGNSTFSYDGRTAYPNWLMRGRWFRLLRELSLSADGRPLWRRALSMAVMPWISPAIRRAMNRGRDGHPNIFESWCPMHPGFARQSGALARARKTGFDPYFYDVPHPREWRAQLLGDFMAEAGEISLGLRLMHGVRQRDPTLYRPFIELCAAIPDDQYLRDGEERWLARRLLQGRIPEQIRSEHRAGRQSADWAIRFGKQRDALMDELLELRQDPYIAARLDLDRLIADLCDWPGTDDPAARSADKIFLAISRAISTARFLRYARGCNVGR